MRRIKEERVRLGIAVSEFNYDITYLMLEKAKAHSEFLGVDVAYITKAHGTFDIPLIVEELLKKEEVDAVVTLGAVIKGETMHDEIIAHQVSRKLIDLSTKYGKPVTLGIIGPGATRAQAQERIEEYAKRSVEAAVKQVKRLSKVRSSHYKGDNTIVVE